MAWLSQNDSKYKEILMFISSIIIMIPISLYRILDFGVLVAL